MSHCAPRACSIRGYACTGLTRRAEDVAKLRAHGIVPILGDLDRLASLDRLRAAPFAVLHFAPPPSEGRDDSAYAEAHRRTGAGAQHTTAVRLHLDVRRLRRLRGRARRRDATAPRAERRARAAASRPRIGCATGRSATASRLSILRAPGIYAETRLPLDRIRQGTPVLAPDDDVFTNHIHAEDLARATVAALFRAKPNRAYNVTDDAEMKMGGWFDTVADAFHLPRPPRVSWEEAERRIAPLLLSFMSESRRLSNARMKRELRVRLRYPTPQRLLDEIAPRDLKKQLALPL